MLPDALREGLAASADEPAKRNAALPPALRDWLAERFVLRAGEREGRSGRPRRSTSRCRVRRGSPGCASTVRPARPRPRTPSAAGSPTLNDLHKGRHAGAAWSGFIDVFAIACLVFCVTGLLILKLHAANRPATWPVTGLGLVLPALIALLLIH
jgi:hypothetical protein